MIFQGLYTSAAFAHIIIGILLMCQVPSMQMCQGCNNILIKRYNYV
jgi:hypothetical protein